MIRFARLSAILALMVALGAPAAQATSLAPLTQDQMTDAADLIIEGTVQRVWTEIDEREHVWTRAEVLVQRSLKGGKQGQVVIVEAAGGVMDDGRFTDVGLAPRYSEGERVLVFLSERRAGTMYGAVAMMAGKYTIKQNPSTGDDMVVRFSVPYSREYDARFIPNPPAAERISLESMQASIEDRLERGWDGQPIPGVSIDHLRAINKVQVK